MKSISTTIQTFLDPYKICWVTPQLHSYMYPKCWPFCCIYHNEKPVFTYTSRVDPRADPRVDPREGYNPYPPFLWGRYDIWAPFLATVMRVQVWKKKVFQGVSKAIPIWSFFTLRGMTKSRCWYKFWTCQRSSMILQCFDEGPGLEIAFPQHCNELKFPHLGQSISPTFNSIGML